MTTISDFEQAFGVGLFETMIIRRNPATYGEWVHQICVDIDEIANDLENYKNIISADRSDEDSITLHVVGRLKSRGYIAAHSGNVGGAVDIVIDSKNLKFQWLGEAKIYDSSSYIMEGFLQLATRYSVAKPGRDHGGLLIYMRDHDSVGHYMDLWRRYLVRKGAEKGVHGLCHFECPLDSLSFLTTHEHQSTGLPYSIRHKPFILADNPQDKSGKKRRSRGRKKTAAIK